MNIFSQKNVYQKHKGDAGWPLGEYENPSLIFKYGHFYLILGVSNPMDGPKMHPLVDPIQFFNQIMGIFD